jgi:hypothetical protein
MNKSGFEQFLERVTNLKSLVTNLERDYHSLNEIVTRHSDVTNGRGKSNACGDSSANSSQRRMMRKTPIRDEQPVRGGAHY